MPFNLDAEHQAQLNEIMKGGRKAYKNGPGFFTPYKSFSEFTSHTIGSIIVVPILGALITAAAAVTAALAIIPALGGFGVAGGAALVGAKDTSNSAFKIAALSALISLAAAAATILFALATVLEAVLAPIAVLTRLGATAYAAVVKTPAQDAVELNGLLAGYPG